MLGSFEVARRPLRHVGPVAMVVLALAAAVFTATTHATWASFRTNAVALAEPADVTLRVVSETSADPEAEVADLAEQLTALPGVEQAMPVFLAAGAQDSGWIEIVGVDPANAADVMSWPIDVAGAPTDELIAAMRESRGSALVTEPLLEQLGLHFGDKAVVRVAGRGLTITVEGSVGAVPGTATPFAIMVNQDVLRQAIREEAVDANGELLELIPLPNQWWLAAADSASAAEAAGKLPGVLGVSTYAEAAAASETDVSYRGLYGGVLGGLVFAVVFGVVGTLLHALSLYGSRSGEHAVLRAVGLRRWSTLVSVTTEQLLLLGFACAVGLGLGLAVSWTTVAQTVGRLAGLPEVPPLVLETPWPVLAVLGAGTAALLTLIVVVASTSLRRVRITSVLRAGGQR